MSYRFMLDTNVISDLIKDPDGLVAKRLEKVGEREVCCSVITAAELRYGAEKAQSPNLTKRIDAALSAIDVLPLGEPSDRHYGFVRAGLAVRGTPIGPNDLLIAAHALTEGLTLVTDNVKEFQRVEGLAVVNWRGLEGSNI